jgi:hypothetical protein
MEIIGGGSLKQRLNGAFLTSCALDMKNIKVYLGTTSGEVYLYEIYQDQMRYLKTITIKNNQAIECLLIKKGFLLS